MGPIGSLPAGGRNWEGFGSDPVLQGIAAAETIHGIQEEGVIATAKHYVLNEQEHYRMPLEWGIENAMSSNIDPRTLREIFVWPFAESVRAGVGSIMCSYQMINSSYGCGNSLLMNGILKDELGFQGFVQSDWWAQPSGVGSALAGLDVTMPGGGPRGTHGLSLWGENLTLAALNTSVPMERLNDMVTRVVAAYYRMGQDEWPKPPPEGDGGPNFSSWEREEIGKLYFGSPDDNSEEVVNRYVEANKTHGPIARTIAAEGTVLLKNEDGILPLSRDGGPPRNETYRVGVFGEDAGPGRGPNACPDRACNQGTLGSGWGSGSVEFPYLITPSAALNRTFNNETVTMSSYLTNEVRDRDLLDKDLCIVFANAIAGEGYLADSDVRGDRNDLFLHKNGDKLVEHVANKCGDGSGDTIVVIHSVGPVLLESWVDLPGVKAVLLANLPGQESGNALTDVMFGEVDASGRLPYTIGKREEDYGPESRVLYETSDAVPQKNFSHGLYLDYRYFDKHDIAPRYEFGFGLSYTTFNISNLTITTLQEKSPFPAPRPSPDVPAPSYNNTPPEPESAVFPSGFRRLSGYLYPYLTSVDLVKRGRYKYPDGYDTVQPLSPAGGGEGGNPSLYEPIVNVTVNLTNTGSRTGKEVVQLYVSFPDGIIDRDESGNITSPIDFPVRVLRNFDKVELNATESRMVEMTLTRKDLSYWSTIRENWVMPVTGRFVIWVGRSSRDLPLRGEF
jgi:beta-glucosidase